MKFEVEILSICIQIPELFKYKAENLPKKSRPGLMGGWMNGWK